MDQSTLANVLGHLAQMSEQQGQLQQVQNEVLTEIAQSVAEDRSILQELVTSSGGEDGHRAAGAVPQIQILQKMGEWDDGEAGRRPSRAWPRSPGDCFRSGLTISCRS